MTNDKIKHLTLRVPDSKTLAKAMLKRFEKDFKEICEKETMSRADWVKLKELRHFIKVSVD